MTPRSSDSEGCSPGPNKDGDLDRGERGESPDTSEADLQGVGRVMIRVSVRGRARGQAMGQVRVRVRAMIRGRVKGRG